MVNKRTAKARGSAAERELLHALYDAGWGAVRAAGSGSIPLEVPDIIAGSNGRVIAVEVKVCGNTRQYFSYTEVVDLRAFCERIGCEAWVGVKFLRRGWYFVPAQTLLSSGKNFVLSYEDAQERGRSIEQLIG